MKDNRNFNFTVFINSAFSNFVSAVLLYFYSVIFISFPVLKYPSATIAGIIIILIAQILTGPITSYLLSRKTSLDLDYIMNGQSSEDERTIILKELYNLPLKKMIETLIHFIICAFLYSYILYNYYHVDFILIVYFLLSCTLASYFAMILSYTNTSSACSREAVKIIKIGISKKEIEKQKYFGLSSISRFILYIVIPTIYCSILFFLVVRMSNTPVRVFSTNLIATTSFLDEAVTNGIHFIYLDKTTQAVKTLFVTVINTVILIYLSFLFFNKSRKIILKIQTPLLNLYRNNYTTDSDFEIDLSSQMSYTLYLLDQTVKYFRDISTKVSLINHQIVNATENLVTISEETSSTSIEQSSTINEVIKTMNNVDNLFNNILLRIDEISRVSDKTKSDVDYGFTSVQSNLTKMLEITRSNQSTLDGIKDLSQKLNSVQDIVNLIDNVADLTKIIAFNAELEASKIESSNKDFLTVSNNIRFLSDNVIELTGKVKQEIKEIKKSSRDLLSAEYDCMKKINEGTDLTQKLRENLSDIKNTANSLSDSTSEINKTSIEQVFLFKSLIEEIKNIQISINDFSRISFTITRSVESLKDDAEHLRILNSGF